MKKITSLLAASLMLFSCSGTKESADDSTAATADSVAPSARLAARLDSAVAQGRYFFGHHDDTAYGNGWKYVKGNSDVKAVTGQYPGLMSWDLGLIEVDSTKNLDGVPFEFIASEAADHDARGGVNAISWHVLNPITGGSSWDVSAAPLPLMADNPAVRDTLVAWIDRAADFIGSLKDKEGNPLPVIFRPWHENSGSWFWWGSDHSSPEEYIALWKLTRERFDTKGVDNVLWAYSPDKDLTREQYFATYPGDEYVDILGTDIYAFDGADGEEQFRSRISNQLPYVCDEARKRGKIAAFTETGLEGLEVTDWYTRVLEPAIKDLPIAYVCVWRNGTHDRPQHFYVPYPGHKGADDFKKFHDNSNAIFVE